MTRDDAGPYVVLGIEKDADVAMIDAQYQSRLFPARRGDLKWSVDDLNWARDQLIDAGRRVAADANSWNLDNASGDVRRLMRLYRMESSAAAWEPLDPEPPLELPIPDVDLSAIIADLSLPDAPLDLPSINAWLEHCASVGTDPWAANVLN